MANSDRQGRKFVLANITLKQLYANFQQDWKPPKILGAGRGDMKYEDYIINRLKCM
jgi:hypothetical protein